MLFGRPSKLLLERIQKIKTFILYAYTFRSRAERVVWTLKELDYPYELIRLDPFKGEASTPEFRYLNPSGKIPVLLHGEKILTESVAIMEYLNDISKQHALVPTGPDEAYHYHKVMSYGLTEIEPYMWLAEQASRLKQLYTWPDGTYEKAINMVKENIGPISQWTEGRAFIGGNQFSLADIYYYSLITWAQQHDGIQFSSATDHYLRQLEQREAFPAEMRSA